MEGTKVQVFLRTPLYRGRIGAAEPRDPERSGMGIRRRASADEALSIDAASVLGEVIAERRTGLHLRVTALLDEHGVPAQSIPFEEMVVPLAKIDYVVLTEA